MTRIVLAAAAAFALASAAPAFASPECKDCPHHKAAAAGTADKKDKAEPKAPAGCACGGEAKPCKCGPEGQCPHCRAKKAGNEK